MILVNIDHITGKNLEIIGLVRGARSNPEIWEGILHRGLKHS